MCKSQAQSGPKFVREHRSLHIVVVVQEVLPEGLLHSKARRVTVYGDISDVPGEKAIAEDGELLGVRVLTGFVGGSGRESAADRRWRAYLLCWPIAPGDVQFVL